MTKEYGVYHCTGEGVCSWCEFAAEIIRLSGIPATVTPCTTEQFIAASEKADRAAPGVFGAGKRHAESDYRK